MIFLKLNFLIFSKIDTINRLHQPIACYFSLHLRYRSHYGRFGEFLSKNSRLKFNHCNCIFAPISKIPKLGKQSTILEPLKARIFKKKKNENAATRVKFMP